MFDNVVGRGAAGGWGGQPPRVEARGVPVGGWAGVLEGVPPGVELVRLLAGVDLARLAEADLVAVLVAWERCAGWVTARGLAVLAELAGRWCAPDQPAGAGVGAAGPGVGEAAPGEVLAPEELVAAEVAVALRLSPAGAGRRVGVAVALAGVCAPTGAALAAGQIGVGQAWAVVEELAGAGPGVAAAVQRRVLPRAARATVARTRGMLRRELLAAEPGAAARRCAAARAGRRVERWTLPDGMGVVHAVLPAEGAALVHAAVDRLAGRGELFGPGEGVDARRADALVLLCQAALKGTPLPAAPPPAGGSPAVGPVVGPAAGPAAGRGPRALPPAEGPDPGRVAVEVRVDLATLLGLAEEPGQLVGYGPIPAALARRLAADGAWRRMVTDPLTGRLLDRGRRVYRPSPALAAFVRARDRSCVFPHCNRAAAGCDLDHRVPFPHGPTTRANLAPLCRRHHRLKTHGGWQLRVDRQGYRWTSPLGRVYLEPHRDQRE